MVKPRKNFSRRLKRELRTLRIMVEMYRRAEHRSAHQPHDLNVQLCEECAVLHALDSTKRAPIMQHSQRDELKEDIESI